jgi:pimeloyl-ACP methyl ester carboxylesterase
VTADSFFVEVPGGRLAAKRWAGPVPTVVLLHAGVADLRSWAGTAERLAGTFDLIAYDRRGFGGSPPGPSSPYRPVDDLAAVLDEVSAGRCWLVGSSQGGKIALDFCLTFPDRVAGLVLLAPAVSGAPESTDLDPATQRLSDLMDAADAAGDLAEVNRLMTWLWLDGPAEPEGRVGGSVRELALAMNAVVLRNEAEDAALPSDVDAWHRLDEIRVPVTVAWGDLDVGEFISRSRHLVDHLPNARGRAIPQTAHLPYLERPDLVAELIRQQADVTPQGR